MKRFVTCVSHVARTSILVLDGPSGLGKTEYVRSLFLRDALLEINARQMKSICLHGFQQSKTRGILWDECSAELVIASRKVFQHSTCLVDIGHSPAGQHVKHVWLNDCVSIICSNRWREDVEALPSESDRAWLRKNCVIVDFREQLWQP